MKKSMVFTALLWGALGTASATVPQSQDASDHVMVAHLPVHPLMMLPGMRSAGSPSAISALPTPLITDVINAPNPFDSRQAGLEGTTQISYTLAADSAVTITLYDLFGRRVRDWSFHAGDNGGRQGTNQLLWDGTNESGRKVSKGGYLAQIEVAGGGSVATVLLKIGVIH